MERGSNVPTSGAARASGSRPAARGPAMGGPPAAQEEEDLQLVVRQQARAIYSLERRLQRSRQREERETERADQGERDCRFHRDCFSELATRMADVHAHADSRVEDAVTDYKASADFAAVMAEREAAGFDLGFDDCRAKVAEMYPGQLLPKHSRE